MYRVIVPSSVGLSALAELDAVPWHELAHAYGTGRLGPSLNHDVRASLLALGDASPESFEKAAEALCSNIYHQGTIYESTAWAVPFLCAFAADPALPLRRARFAGVLLGRIAIASSDETDDGTTAGSFSEDVAENVRQAFRTSAAQLVAAGGAHRALGPICAAMGALLLAEWSDVRAVDAVAECVTELESGDDDDDTTDVPRTLTERVQHAKFGPGVLFRREGDKARVRFDDGSERVLLERFLTKAD